MRHGADKTADYHLGIDAEHTVGRSRHADIGNIRRAAGQNALIRGGNMSVRSSDGGNSAVKVDAHCYLLRRCLGVKIKHRGVILSRLARKYRVGGGKG